MPAIVRLTALVLFFSSAVLAEPTNLKVGAILPLSGELASIGGKLRDGIIFANEDQGKKAQIIFQDRTLDKKLALTALQNLTNDGIHYVIGPFGPDQTIALAGPAKRNKTLLVSIALCAPEIEQLENVFCLFPRSVDQVRPLLRLMEIQRPTSVAYLGEGLLGFEEYRNLISRKASILNIPFALNETVTPGTTDVRAVLSRLAKSKPSLAVVAGANLSTLLSIFRQMSELGVNPDLKWYLGEHDVQFFEKNSQLLEGTYSLAIPEIDTNFSVRFKKRFGYEPDLYSALVYDGSTALFRASLNSTADDWHTVAKQMTIPSEETATKSFRFDSSRRVGVPVYLTRILSGKITIVK